jgi:hypothetical protein
MKILKTNSSESSENERPESPEIALIIDVTDEATPETSPSYCPPLLPFTTNSGLNTDIQNTDVMSFVNLFITNYYYYQRKCFSIFSSVHCLIPSKPFVKSNPEVRMGYLDVMKTVPCTLLLGSEMELSNIPPSPESMESASTASSSMQPPVVSHQKEPPQKTLHFG